MEQDLRNALSQAVELTGQSRDVFKLFWSAQQRFFKLLCVSMKACSPPDTIIDSPASFQHAFACGISCVGYSTGFLCWEQGTSKAYCTDLFAACILRPLSCTQGNLSLLEGEAVMGGLQSTGKAAADMMGSEPCLAA